MEVTDFYKANIYEATVYTKTSPYSVYQVTVAVLTVNYSTTVNVFNTGKKGGNFVSIMYM